MAPLTQDQWDQLPLTEATAFAKRLESRLGGRFNFQKISRCEQPGAWHNVAFFLQEDRRFALVLKGSARLGCKPQHVENADELYSRDHHQLGWISPIELTLQSLGCETAREPANPPATLAHWLEAMLTQPRQVQTSDLLVAVEPEPAESSRRLEAHGFRLPSSDEWEHLSNAGSTTLFRWGNLWPTDEGFAGHLLPNAFGLRFSDDPYCPECVSEEFLMRGGDGGEMICAGIGPLAWLTFASSYVCRSPSITEDPEVWLESALVRPVWELEPLEI